MLDIILRDNIWSVIILPGWFALALVIRIARKDHFNLLLGHLAFGLAAFFTAWCGIYILSTAKAPFGPLWLVGGIIFSLGNAVLWGWIVSPGGSQFTLTPFLLFTGRAIERGIDETNVAYWSKLSTITSAFLCVAMSALFLWSHIKMFNIG